MIAPVAVTLWASGFVITRFWAPATPAGIVQLIVPELSKVTGQGLPPIVTVGEVTKLVPVIIRVSPPASGEAALLTLVKVGGGL
jgi:hypothetical protein